jgi:hypothetical protein
MRWDERGCRVSANEYSCAHGVQINFEDPTPYLTYEEKVQNTVRLQQGFTSKNAQYTVHTVYYEDGTAFPAKRGVGFRAESGMIFPDPDPTNPKSS